MRQTTSIDVYYQMAIDRLEAQIKRMDGVDNKIGMIFGLTNGITAALVVAVTSLTRPIMQPSLILAILTFAAYVCTLVILYCAYKWSKWSYRPDLDILAEYCTKTPYRNLPDSIKVWVARECTSSLNRNRKPIQHKVYLASMALKSVSAQGLLLAAFFISHISLLMN